MGSISPEAGRTLRRIREDRELTLLDVATRSGGEFKPSAVAAYERGQRNLSLDRFCGLCRLYEVEAGRLLGAIMRAAEGRPPVVIDLTRLEALPIPVRDVVGRFVSEVRTLRGAPRGESLAIRSGDLEVLAPTSGRRKDELGDELGVTPHRPST